MDITLTMLMDLAFPGNTGNGGVLCADSGGVSGPGGDEDEDGKTAPIPVRGIRIWNDAKTTADEGNGGLIFLKKQKSGVLFICGGRRITFETELAFAEVFNKLEETFTALRDWDMQLHQGIIENKGFQYMVDVSETIFRRPMAITDSGYKRIAQTKLHRDGDPIFRDLREKGYLSSDAISQLDKAGFIFEKKKIVFRAAIEGYSYPMLNGTVFIEHDYRYMLTLLFPLDDYTDGIYELFAFFLGQLTLYIETNGDAHRIRRFVWMSLLADLAEGKCGPAEFAERNNYSDLPEGCGYHLVAVRRKDGTMRGFMQNWLEQLLPGRFVFIHGESVLILLTDKGGPGRPLSAGFLSDQAIETISENHFYVCVSNRFETLIDLRHAYSQANAAYDLALLISKNRTFEKLGITIRKYDEFFLYYSDYYPYDMISGSPRLSPEFRTLLAEDNRTAAGNLRLLYVYLKNDCSKTRTAAELYMHRNNVIYRISKLEETLGLSLSDEQVKTAFRISFLALELLGPETLL